MEPFTILTGIENTYDFSVDILNGLFTLLKKIGWNENAGRGIKLGGLKMRRSDEMLEWLIARQRGAKLKTVHASFAGLAATHDRWNGRSGDFDFLFDTLKIAATLGLHIHQRIFVVRSTLPDLDRLLDKLDEIPTETLRYLSVFIYQGNALHLEDERITENMRDRLPERVKVIANRPGESWLSEREWLADHANFFIEDRPTYLNLELEVMEDNLSHLESLSCDEIVSELTERVKRTHATLPSLSELAARYGDPNNRRVYTTPEELERVWLMRHFTDH